MIDGETITWYNDVEMVARMVESHSEEIMMSWQKLQRFDDKIEHKNKNFNVNILSYTRIYNLANHHNFMLSFIYYIITYESYTCIYSVK